MSLSNSDPLVCGIFTDRITFRTRLQRFEDNTGMEMA